MDAVQQEGVLRVYSASRQDDCDGEAGCLGDQTGDTWVFDKIRI